jgi:hypothetical protein
MVCHRQRLSRIRSQNWHRLQEARNQVCAKFCHAHRDDHQWVCRTIDAELRSRASIGPDSERIREFEADDLDAIEDKWLQQCGSCDAGLPLSCSHPSEDYRPVMLTLVTEIRRLRRAAGLLPGPDDIVVSREALVHLWAMAEQGTRPEATCSGCNAVRAALSQPHPAQEQQ